MTMKRSVLLLVISIRSLSFLAQGTSWKHKEDESIHHHSTSLKATGRIVGGSQPNREDYPSFVRIDKIPNRRHCAGTLIHPRLALSAAHCAAPVSHLEAVVNAYSTYNNYYDKGQLYRLVEQVVIHPSFLGGDNSRDIMILKLSQPVPSSTVPPAQLNTSPSSPANGTAVIIVGMGRTLETGSPSSMLQHATVLAMDGTTCLNKLSAPYRDDTMFCAGMDEGGIDACNGDSGGPVFLTNNILVGVTSWGRGCARAAYPGVYSRVSASIDWIHTQMCELVGEQCSSTTSTSQSSPTPKPVSPTPKPVSPTPKPVSPTPKPVSPTPKPVSPTPKPVSPPTPKPVSPPTPKPVSPPTPKPVSPTLQPVPPPTPIRLVNTNVIKRDESCVDDVNGNFLILGSPETCAWLADLPQEIQIRICTDDGNDSKMICPYTCGASCNREAGSDNIFMERPMLRHNGGQ